MIYYGHLSQSASFSHQVSPPRTSCPRLLRSINSTELKWGTNASRQFAFDGSSFTSVSFDLSTTGAPRQTRCITWLDLWPLVDRRGSPAWSPVVRYALLPGSGRRNSQRRGPSNNPRYGTEACVVGQHCRQISVVTFALKRRTTWSLYWNSIEALIWRSTAIRSRPSPANAKIEPSIGQCNTKAKDHADLCWKTYAFWY